MTRATTGRATELSRREFLAATGGALAGAVAYGWGGQAEAAKRHPQRGGTLKFAMRSDSQALDPHRNIIYLQPAISGPYSYQGGGIRTAWLE